MDVLRPPVVCIGGRCYRKNSTADEDAVTGGTGDNFATAEGDSGHQGYHEYPDIADDGDEECDDLELEQTENGNYKLHLNIPSIYFKYLIGKKGETKQRLEAETRTQVHIPRQGKEGKVVVSGPSRTSVLSARTRIEVLVDSGRQKQPFTHFLSLPLNLSLAQERFAEFKEDVLRFCNEDRGIDGSIFQNPEKLHLTIGTLVLANDAEIDKASELLHDCEQNLMRPVLQQRPLMVQLKGLEYMNDDPAEVDVLYCMVQPLDGSDRLQVLADQLVERFVSAGFMQRQYEKVKLHVTLINTLFRQERSGNAAPAATSRDRKRKPRESFDAARILKVVSPKAKKLGKMLECFKAADPFCKD